MRALMAAALVFALAAEAAAITEFHDVVYRTVDGVSLALDIYLPDGAGPHPAVLLVHGGAWHTGDKGGSMATLGRFLAARGYAAFSANYRLAPEFTFPAALEDLRCAVKWIRQRATAYGVDPDRVAAAGASAGGHLVALLGTAPESLGPCGDPAVSSRVQAVVSFYGPMDLTVVAGTAAEPGVAEFLGATYAQDPNLWREASPITWVSPDDPPFLLIHGRDDHTVSYRQSVRMADALRRIGVEAELLIIPGAGHGFLSRPRSPAARIAVSAMLRFLEGCLSP